MATLTTLPTKVALIDKHSNIPYAPTYVYDSGPVTAATSINVVIPDNARFCRFKRAPTDGTSDSTKTIFVRFQAGAYSAITVKAALSDDGTAASANPEYYQIPLTGSGNHFAVISPNTGFNFTIDWAQDLLGTST